MTKPWDKYRGIIVDEYKDQNRPLHEVQRIMRERYGFKASTRAYRSRLDRWGIHKYSRRRRMRSMSHSRRGSTADDAVRPSPQPSPDVGGDISQAGSPVLAPSGRFNPGLCGTAPEAAFGSPVCLVKPGYQYSSATPSPISAIDHSPVFPPNQFGIRLDAFNPQGIVCYSSNSAAIYPQAHQDVMVLAPDPSPPGPGNIPQAGIHAGYAYSLGFFASARE